MLNKINLFIDILYSQCHCHVESALLLQRQQFSKIYLASDQKHYISVNWSGYSPDPGNNQGASVDNKRIVQFFVLQ